MRRTLLVAAMLFAVPALAADTKAAPAADTRPAAGAPTDPEIAHIAVTANQVDIDAGKQAEKKANSPKVKEFAKRMVDDHTAVIKEAQDLVKKLKVTPKDNATSKSLTDGGAKTRKELAAKKGDDFDKAYVDNEVAYHQAVIDAVDEVLLPNAQNAELKGLLEKVRPALVAHLDHAKSIQKELAGGAATGGAGHEHDMKK